MKDDFGNAAVVHAPHMVKPPEAPLALAQERVHKRDPSTCENIAVGYMVLPLDIQDTPQVKGAESAFLAHVGACLTAVKKRAEDACLVDTHLGVLREEVVLMNL